MSARYPVTAAGAGALLGVALLLGLADAQSPAKRYRIGFLFTAESRGLTADFYLGGHLRQLGMEAGLNVAFETRSTEGRPDRLAAVASELVALDVDVIVTGTTAAVQAVRRATGTIPIVAVSGDLVGARLVQALDRPGGNVTGLTSEPAASYLRLLKEAVPRASRVAVLWDATGVPGFVQRATLGELQAAAGPLGVTLHSFEVAVPASADRYAAYEIAVRRIEEAFAGMARERVDGLIVLPGGLIGKHRREITPLIARQPLPTLTQDVELLGGYPDANAGLLAYTPNFPLSWERVAYYVYRLFKGARPGDLSVEPQPAVLTVNLRAARRLGLTLPPSLLDRADHLIR